MVRWELDRLARIELGAHAPQRAREDLLHVGEAQAHRLGDLGPAQIAAEAQRDDLALAVAERREGALEVRVEPEVGLIWAGFELPALGLEPVERLIAAGAVGPEVIDEQVARDDQQPCADARLRRVVTLPRAQGAFEGLLRQVLGVCATAQTVGEEAVDLPDVVVIDGGEVAQGTECTRRIVGRLVPCSLFE